MDKYRRNFILCDRAVYYCLLCDELLREIPYVERHIRWDNHRKNLRNQVYFPRFRKDSIYKVDNHFYCELCNFVASDVDAVTKHVNNDGHKAMKNDPKTEAKIIGQYNSGFIVINKIKLNMAQWNSIINKKCLICNIEVNDIKLHMGLKEHMINLINSKIKCENERYYRKINNDKYHCFSCKKVFSAQKFNNHWLSCKNIDEKKIKTHKEVKSSKNIGNSSECRVIVKEIHDQLLGPLIDLFLLDRQKNSATCKHCNSLMTINVMPMAEHMKSHLNIEELKTSPNKAEYYEPVTNAFSHEVVHCKIIDSGKRRSELAKLGKDNSIKLNFNGSKGWCLVCDRYLSAHKKIFYRHIDGATHQGNLELQGLISPKKHDIECIKAKSILQCRLEYLLEEEEFYLFDYLSIDVFSFFLLCKIEDPHFKKTKCYACNELLQQGQEREHCSTPKHRNKFLAAKYVFSHVEERQFFREIRRNYFHCGFCNKTFPFLKQLLTHMVCIQHRMMQISKTGLCVGSIKFNTKSDDVYMKLVHYGFGKK